MLYLYFFSPTTNIGLAHSLTTQYSKITGTFENYSVTVSTAQTHGLQTDDKIKFKQCPLTCDFKKCIYECYDKKLNLKYYDRTTNLYKKLTKDKIDFSTFTNTLARNEIDFCKEKVN